MRCDASWRTSHRVIVVLCLVLGAWLVARNVDRLPALTLERVIGILQHKGTSLGMDFDDMVIIPSTAAMDLFALEAFTKIEARAPERTDTRRGFLASPKEAPMDFSSFLRASSSCFHIPWGYCDLLLV